MAKQYFTEIGKSGIKWSQGTIQEEFLSQLRDKSGVRTFREMSDNDSIVGACLFAIKQILREARWSVQVPDGGKEEDGKLLEDCMSGMSHSWNDMVIEVLSMLIYGWSLLEIVYKRQKNGRVGWKKIALRSQTAYERWEMDESGSIVGMWQKPAPDFKLIYLPLSKCLLFRTELAGDNPMGRSILRCAYRAWYFKKHLEEIEGIGVERDLAGIPVIKPPESFDMDVEDSKTVAAITAAKKLIANIRRDEQDGVFLPSGWEISLLSSPGQRQFDTTSIINRYAKAIAVSVLAEFVMLGMERTGSYALSIDQTDMFHKCLEGWADSIASLFNRFAVPKLFVYNGIVDRPLPQIVHTRVQGAKLRDLAYYVNQLAGVEALDVDEDLKTYLKNFARLSEFKEARK